jgi:hypothetical protein
MPTFAEQDRMRAAREEKKIECVARLSKVLAREFSLDELRFMWGYSLPPSSIITQAWEDARLEAKK